jgi:hypothetical protein
VSQAAGRGAKLLEAQAKLLVQTQAKLLEGGAMQAMHQGVQEEAGYNTCSLETTTDHSCNPKL